MLVEPDLVFCCLLQACSLHAAEMIPVHLMNLFENLDKFLLNKRHAWMGLVIVSHSKVPLGLDGDGRARRVNANRVRARFSSAPRGVIRCRYCIGCGAIERAAGFSSPRPIAEPWEAWIQANPEIAPVDLVASYLSQVNLSSAYGSALEQWLLGNRIAALEILAIQSRINA